VDYFKKINDTFGHQEGDLVLKKIADTIKTSFRDVDIKGRYGGEEFLILFPETEKENAHISAERFRKAIENLSHANDSMKITISGGIASFRPEDTALELLQRADGFLYEAKKQGRNRILFG